MSTAPMQYPEEQRISAMAEKPVESKTKDWWDKAQIISGFLSSVVIATIGMIIQLQLKWNQDAQNDAAAKRQIQQARFEAENRNHQGEIEEANRQSQFIAQMQSNRERSDAEIRTKMFDTLSKEFFDPSVQQDMDKQMKLLVLCQSNFHEFFNAGPLFEMLAPQIEDKGRLRDFLRELAGRQEMMLGGGTVKNITLSLRDQKETPIQVGQHQFFVTLTDLKEDHAKIKLRDPDGHHFNEIEFDVSYFDMPLTDNTMLQDGHRLAVTLKATGTAAGTADLKIFEFTHDNYVTPRDRPPLSQLHKQAVSTVKTWHDSPVSE